MSLRPLIVANWKMYKRTAEAAAALKTLAARRDLLEAVELVVAPSATALDRAASVTAGGGIALAAQNCHWEPDGAHTGEVSVAQVADVGCTYALVGHSERRQGMGETNEQVRRKTAALLAGGLTPIICLGETTIERRAGKTEQIVAEQATIALQALTAAQVSRVVIAYEPVWAIGTGRTASPAEAVAVHRFLRQLLAHEHGEPARSLRILYGGSVSPDTIDGLLAEPEIGGALVGGASLNPPILLAILERAAAAFSRGRDSAGSARGIESSPSSTRSSA